MAFFVGVYVVFGDDPIESWKHDSGFMFEVDIQDWLMTQPLELLQSISRDPAPLYDCVMQAPNVPSEAKDVAIDAAGIIQGIGLDVFDDPIDWIELTAERLAAIRFWLIINS